MAQCKTCKRDMLTTDGCDQEDLVFPDGTQLPQLLDTDLSTNKRCHDCNAKHGYVHHPGCDVERCPRCEGQFISCYCLDG